MRAEARGVCPRPLSDRCVVSVGRRVAGGREETLPVTGYRQPSGRRTEGQKEKLLPQTSSLTSPPTTQLASSPSEQGSSPTHSP